MMNNPDLPKTRGRAADGQPDSAHLTKPNVRFSVVSKQGREAGEGKAA